MPKRRPRECIGNLFKPDTYVNSRGFEVDIHPDVILIPSNGFIAHDGTAVMGRGVARIAAERWPSMPKILGEKIMRHGNQVNKILVDGGIAYYSFPVKPPYVRCVRDKTNVVAHMRARFSPGDVVPGWAARGDLEIIEESARQAQHLARANGWQHVALPRVGAGNAELPWAHVYERLAKHMDDRFIIVQLYAGG